MQKLDVLFGFHHENRTGFRRILFSDSASAPQRMRSVSHLAVRGNRSSGNW
jgi:hypothetical protein